MWGIIAFITLNMLLPSKIQNPVEGCGKNSYSPLSFWHPWGDHKHRGVDIFAPKGTVIHPAVGGIVVAAMHTNGAGGNIVLVFSSKMRFHYYAHMSEIDNHLGSGCGCVLQKRQTHPAKGARLRGRASRA